MKFKQSKSWSPFEGDALYLLELEEHWVLLWALLTKSNVELRQIPFPIGPVKSRNEWSVWNWSIGKMSSHTRITPNLTSGETGTTWLGCFYYTHHTYLALQHLISLFFFCFFFSILTKFSEEYQFTGNLKNHLLYSYANLHWNSWRLR